MLKIKDKCICRFCNEDINEKHQINMSWTSIPMCEDCFDGFMTIEDEDLEEFLLREDDEELYKMFDGMYTKNKNY